MKNVSVIMGSISDWDTMKSCCDLLDYFGVSYEKKVISAHRTPKAMMSYASKAVDGGLTVIIAAAGGAAHLPGMIASFTTLPVIGVPIQSKALNGIDSLLSIVQMPEGVPVATVAIGTPGAKNAAILAVQIIAAQQKNRKLQKKLADYKKKMESDVHQSNKLLK